MSLEIKIPKEIDTYHETVALGMSLKQCVCVGLGALVGGALYILINKLVGRDVAAWLAILSAAPFGAAGFVSWHGMTAGRAFATILFYLRVPKEIPHRPTNTYYVMIDAMKEEEERIEKASKKRRKELTEKMPRKAITLTSKIPRIARDLIPITRMWEDGIYLTTDGRYTRTYEIRDVNFEALDAAEREQTEIQWCTFLNALEDDTLAKVSLVVRRRRREDIASGLLSSDAEDGLDEYRHELNEVIVDSSTGELCMQRRIFLTLSIAARDAEAAKMRFGRVDDTVSALLLRIGSNAKPLRGTERIVLLHELMRLGDTSESKVKFDWHEEVMRGTDLRDTICPSSITVSHSHLKLGNRYCQSCFIERYSNSIHDDLMARLCDTGRDMIISVDLEQMKTEAAQKFVERKLDGVNTNAVKYAQRQVKNSNWSATLPYQLEEQQRALNELMEDIRERDQKLIHTGFTLVHFADSADVLDAGADAIKTCFHTDSVRLTPLTFQQAAGLVTALPFGVRKTSYTRTLTTEAVCAFIPFRAQEVQDEGGIYYGRNSLSRSPIIADRFKPLNYNSFRLGVPGSGKSLGAKYEIAEVILCTGDSVMICDPEGEYSDFVRAMGGQVVRIAPKSGDHINAMDLDKDYGDSDPVAEKADYLFTLMSQIKQQPMSAYERSVLDRCVGQIYEQYKRGGKAPRLPMLIDILKEQAEPEAQNLALVAEPFVSGSLDTFSYETNVDMSNRLISFDISDVGNTLKPVAIAVIIDAFRNRVAKNNRDGKRTRLYMDEFHNLLDIPQMARFLDISWRQFRKRGGAPTGITQNVQTLLASPTASAMLANSECIVMHAQGYEDAAALAELLHIPDTLVTRLTNAEAGTGLLRIGKQIIPFDNRLPKHLKLYSLISTNPVERAGGDEL